MFIILNRIRLRRLANSGEESHIYDTGVPYIRHKKPHQIYLKQSEVPDSKLVESAMRVGAPTGGSPSGFCSAKTVGRGRGRPREHDIERCS